MGQLQVTVVEARNLKQKDTFTENDAYVKIYLDKKKQNQKSKTKQNSNNPIWNETFVFNHLQGQNTLHLDVYDADSMKDDKIGSLKIDLADLYGKGQIDNWYKLTTKLGLVSHGEIHLILQYEQLQI